MVRMVVWSGRWSSRETLVVSFLGWLELRRGQGWKDGGGGRGVLLTALAARR